MLTLWSQKLSSQTRAPIDLFAPLLFLYFVTLHADQLSLPLGGYQIRLNNFIALTLLIVVIARSRAKLFVIHRPLAIGLAAIALSMILSWLFSPYKMRCAVFFMWFLLTAVCYVWLPFQLMLREKTRTLLKLYFASFIFVGLYATAQLLISLVGIHDPFAPQTIFKSLARPNAFAYEPSFYALYLTPFVMLMNFHYLMKTEDTYLFSPLKKRHVLLINALFLLSTTTSALFAYFCFLSLLPLIIKVAKLPNPAKTFTKFLISALLITCVMTLIAPTFMRHYFFKFFTTTFFAHRSFYERWIGIANAWHAFCDHPWLGSGLGGYPAYFCDVWAKGDHRFIYLYQDLLIDYVPNLKLFEAHNVFTELLASLGVVGLGVFGGLFVLFLRQAKKAYQVEKVWSSGFLLSTLVMLFVLQFNQGLLRTYVWVYCTFAYAYFVKITEPFTLIPNNLENIAYEPQITY